MFLLDTCIYGVLVDKKHEEFERIGEIINYAKEHRESFVSTLIIFDELNKMDESLLEVVYPEYINGANSMLEQKIAEKHADVKKLAWRYIQRLGITDAHRTYHDALNYS